ncbi:hypothetical protein PMI04_014940 [Sphingobium sp. AP49]|uniref:hypothetical protein n=1 Tax=Sphingobium sp. AP49 TaxID=1144307 RepID=UPI00026EE729|nr:hypothetical protein [Sphingobium sp. AP49]WHO37855.1 hypothetical protein PMI04_014940 [Sphingobium sp. AP49]
MASPAAVIVNTAQGVASYLDGISERKRANDVRRLCRSNAGYRAQIITLHHDNMQLRARVAELEAKHV